MMKFGSSDTKLSFKMSLINIYEFNIFTELFCMSAGRLLANYYFK